MSSWRRFIAMWMTVGGYVVAVIVLIAIQGLLDMAGLLSYLAGLIPFLVLHIALLALFFRQMRRVSDPPEYREAGEQGIPARGRVLEVRRTGWRHRRRMAARKYEHLLHVAVERPGETPYQAWLTTFLRSDQQAPQVGDEIAVKVHPQRPAVVVLGDPD